MIQNKNKKINQRFVSVRLKRELGTVVSIGETLVFTVEVDSESNCVLKGITQRFEKKIPEAIARNIDRNISTRGKVRLERETVFFVYDSERKMNETEGNIPSTDFALAFQRLQKKDKEGKFFSILESNQKKVVK